MEFPGVTQNSLGGYNQNLMQSLQSTSGVGGFNQGYVGKSKLKSSGGSVRSKSMRSRSSHASNRRRLANQARKKPGRFNENLETASRKSGVSRRSNASKVASQASRASKRPYAYQAPAQAQAPEEKRQQLINQIE